MKRGLKGSSAVRKDYTPLCYNHCPDEKGTESPVPRGQLLGDMGYNHCPDEKGTES